MKRRLKQTSTPTVSQRRAELDATLDQLPAPGLVEEFLEALGALALLSAST